MSDYKHHARQIGDSLKLSVPPVAVAFCDEVPPNIPAFDGLVAAGCEFWEKASSSVFTTSAYDHQLCSIGVHTHNLVGAPAAQQEELATTLKAMADLDYIRADEVATIPVKQKPNRFVVYGPLVDFPLQTDVVILFAHGQQGLILSEAIERVDKTTPLAIGRPACAMVPQVMNQNQAAMSLGCCGARAYIDALNDSTVRWALPGNKLPEYCEQITALANANNALNEFHLRSKADVAAGQTPTVKESLQRM